MSVEIRKSGETVVAVSKKQAVDAVERPYKAEVSSSIIIGGTRNYERLSNKPRIEEVELVGNKDLEDFGMDFASRYDIAMLFT